MNKWYEITNKADTTPAVYLYDEVGGYGISAQDFLNELNAIKSDKLDVHINSVGGEVFQGFAIYQALKEHPAEVTVMVDALAASIASVIAMAGDRVLMAKNAEFMIHDGHVQLQGNAADLMRMVDTLDRASNNIASVYAERAGGDIATWRNAMRDETWYSAEEAVAAGLADEVLTSKKAFRNVADLQIFNYAGRSFAPAPKNVDKPKTEPYGDVEYADPGYQEDGQKRYPVDTEEHVRSAWSYINKSENAAKYSSEQLATIKTKIKKAAKKFGVQISDAIDTESLIRALKEGFNE